MSEFKLETYRFRAVERLSARELYNTYRNIETFEREVKNRFARKIGEHIIERIATVRTVEYRDNNTYNVMAEYYAIPPHVVQVHPSDVIRVPDRVEIVKPPSAYVKENIDRVMQIFDDAYNISFMNPEDQLPPERRGIMAVLEYLSR